MNRDTDFTLKLRDVLTEAQAAAERHSPGEVDSQAHFIIGWMCGEAGIPCKGESDD